MDALIQVNDLTKFYGTTLVLDPISSQDREDEVFGFFGHNGARKTPTIRMVWDSSHPIKALRSSMAMIF